MRIIFIGIFFSLAAILMAQTSVNPDISVIGQLKAAWDGESTELSGSSVELAFQGYVNPFARVDVFLHKHMAGEPLEVEEAVLAIERGLPLGLALRSGKMRPSFGRINRQHMHTFPQILLPEPVAQMLGEEQWGSAGLEAAWLLPLAWYTNLSLAYLQNGIGEQVHDHEAGGEEAEDAAQVGKAISGRISSFFDLGSFNHLELGLSGYQELESAKVAITALDWTYKWRPDKYRSLVWQTEVFVRAAHHEAEEDHPAEEEDQHQDQPQVTSAYSLVNYQFNKTLNAGCIVDYSSALEDARYHSGSLFLGYAPAEETTVFRLVFKQAWLGNESLDPQALIQILWSLGPHKAHQF